MGLWLDADSKVTWHSDFEMLVYGEKIWSKIETKLNSGEILSQAFLFQLTCSDEGLNDDVARYLRNKAREILSTQYSHVIGYHGCRPRDPESYLKHGILPSNIDRLISEARSLFQGMQGFDEALRDIGTMYLNHNSGKVGLLLSAVRAINDPANSHAEGSELIRALANRLGKAAESILEETGKSTFIKCRIPVVWLDSHTTFPILQDYSNQVIENLIRIREWPNDPFIGFSGAYMLTRSVPSENILEFIDISHKDRTTGQRKSNS